MSPTLEVVTQGQHPPPSESDPAALRAAWPLDPDLAFLNHGSFGACPRAVLDVQSAMRERMERQPVQFFVRDLEAEAKVVRERIGAFVDADPDDIALVTNASTGVNAVLRSLDFEPDDEILITSHGYNACNNTARFVAERWGAKVVTATIPVPVSGDDEIVDSLVRATTERTRLAIIDHVTSPTAIVFPIARIVRELESRGTQVLVDGAHGPGQLDLSVASIGASYYTGNFHKWLCAPKGAGFLHVRRDRQAGIHPTVISHGRNLRKPGASAFRSEFDWVGTLDPTAWLAVPAAIDVVAGLLPGGWPAIRKRNHEVVVAGARCIAEVAGLAPVTPPTMCGSMAALVLPPSKGGPPTSALYADPLQSALLERYRVEVPVVPWPQHPARLVRISAHLYNRPAEYERLAEGLRALLAEGAF